MLALQVSDFGIYLCCTTSERRHPTDGIKADENGCVFAGTGDGVHVFTPYGKLLGKICMQPFKGCRTKLVTYFSVPF